MKKLISIILVLIALMSFSCGSDLTIGNKHYETYGILNENDVKDTNIKYEVIWGNLVLGILLCETIVAPVYFFGFSLFEPVGEK